MSPFLWVPELSPWLSYSKYNSTCHYLTQLSADHLVAERPHAIICMVYFHMFYWEAGIYTEIIGFPINSNICIVSLLS
jgi:hypothetical protein